MPQLDKVTFFSQYFWLCVFFFGFYIVCLKFFLPEISRILKFRKKRLSESSTITLQGENSKVRNSTETALENLFKNLRSVFKEASVTNDKWFSEHKSKFSANFKKGDLKYLQSIAKKSLSNGLSIQSSRTNFSSKIALILLSERFLSLHTILRNKREVVKRNYTTLSLTSSVEKKAKRKKEKKYSSLSQSSSTEHETSSKKDNLVNKNGISPETISESKASVKKTPKAKKSESPKTKKEKKIQDIKTK